MKFENSALAYQAAINELGIVIAQRAFVEEELRTGRLVAPLELVATSANAYYLAYPPGRRSSAIIDLFERWMIGEAKITQLAMDVGDTSFRLDGSALAC